MAKTWGLLCPEGHGLLIEREEWTKRGVVWCPDTSHGGNGRFWRTSEVKEGWWSDKDKPDTPDRSHADYLEERAAARTAAFEENRRRHMAQDKPKKERKAAAVKEPQACLCGCGGLTKGGRFIPGHDARYHSRIRALEAQGLSHDEAAKVAAKGPLTGKYAAAAAKAKPAPAAKAEAPKTRKPKVVDMATREPVDEAGDAIPAEPDETSPEQPIEV